MKKIAVVISVSLYMGSKGSNADQSPGIRSDIIRLCGWGLVGSWVDVAASDIKQNTGQASNDKLEKPEEPKKPINNSSTGQENSSEPQGNIVIQQGGMVHTRRQKHSSQLRRLGGG